jgi:hypothetical protein
VDGRADASQRPGQIANRDKPKVRETAEIRREIVRGGQVMHPDATIATLFRPTAVRGFVGEAPAFHRYGASAGSYDFSVVGAGAACSTR